MLRAAPWPDHPALVRFDATLRGGLSSILNCEISGFLGHRLTFQSAMVDFVCLVWWCLLPLPSWPQLQPLFPSRKPFRRNKVFRPILWCLQLCPDGSNCLVRLRLKVLPGVSRGNGTQPQSHILDEECTNPSDKARLLASRDPRGGDWLQALPISSCGLTLYCICYQLVTCDFS